LLNPEIPLKAKRKLESILDKSKIYYIDESKSILLNNNVINRHMDLDTYKVFYWDTNVQTKPIPSQIIINIQNSRSMDYKPDSNPHGYLKINLKKFLLTVPRWGGGTPIVAFYIEDEDKFFFKTTDVIHAYIEAAIKGKTKDKKVFVPAHHIIQQGIKYIKLLPDNPAKYSYYFEDANMKNNSNKKYRTSFITQSIATEFPLLFNEEEFIELMGKFNNYPDIFKLKYKTLTRLLER